MGSSYHLYFNNKDNKYYLYVLKKTTSDLEYKGHYKLGDDLIWKKLD